MSGNGDGTKLSYREISKKFGGPLLAHAAYLDTLSGRPTMTKEEVEVFGASVDPQILQALALDRIGNIIGRGFEQVLMRLDGREKRIVQV